jgi:hypothetical protein
MSNAKIKEIQSFNWLVAGSQRTGKTVGSLTVIAELQIMAYFFQKVKRVFIFNPNNQNPILEKKSLINEAIRHTIPAWKMPGKFRKISYRDIERVANEKSNLYDWCIIEDGELEDFCKGAVRIRDGIIFFDDLNNIVTANLNARRFDDFKEIFAGNRKRANETIITYHSFAQVPPRLWTYFQRCIVRQTDGENEDFNTIRKCKSTLIKAQQEVRAENKITKYVNNLRLSERIVWMDQDYLFYRRENDLITKIDGVFYKAAGDDIIQI